MLQIALKFYKIVVLIRDAGIW